LRDFNIPEKDLKKIAFDTSRDVANLASNPGPLSEPQILKILKGYF